jgi:hypothetical protein
MVGQPVSPHAAYLPPHSGHTAFNPAPSHPAHLQYPSFAHALHPTSMTMVQNPQAMVHQPGAPPLAGNLGLDMAAMVPGSQVGAFQQNQWTTQSFWDFGVLLWLDKWNFGSVLRENLIEVPCCNMQDRPDEYQVFCFCFCDKRGNHFIVPLWFSRISALVFTVFFQFLVPKFCYKSNNTELPFDRWQSQKPKLTQKKLQLKQKKNLA